MIIELDLTESEKNLLGPSIQEAAEKIIDTFIQKLLEKQACFDTRVFKIVTTTGKTVACFATEKEAIEDKAERAIPKNYGIFEKAVVDKTVYLITDEKLGDFCKNHPVDRVFHLLKKDRCNTLRVQAKQIYLDMLEHS